MRNMLVCVCVEGLIICLHVSLCLLCFSVCVCQRSECDVIFTAIVSERVLMLSVEVLNMRTAADLIGLETHTHTRTHAHRSSTVM